MCFILRDIVVFFTDGGLALRPRVGKASEDAVNPSVRADPTEDLQPMPTVASLEYS